MTVRRAALLAAASLTLAWTTPHGRPACRGHDISTRLCAFYYGHVAHHRFR